MSPPVEVRITFEFAQTHRHRLEPRSGNRILRSVGSVGDIDLLKKHRFIEPRSTGDGSGCQRRNSTASIGDLVRDGRHDDNLN